MSEMAQTLRLQQISRIQLNVYTHVNLAATLRTPTVYRVQCQLASQDRGFASRAVRLSQYLRHPVEHGQYAR